MDHYPPFLIIGPFPPPVHGFSAMTQAMAERLETFIGSQRVDLSIPLSASCKFSKLIYHLLRVGRSLVACACAIHFRFTKGKKAYLACNGNFGLLHTILIALVLRALGYQIFLHHHSFGYVNRYSRLMAVLVWIGSGRMTHIFLCETMRSIFMDRYKNCSAYEILSNATFLVQESSPTLVQDRNVRISSAHNMTIGLLSNLNHEKGLYDFLDLMERIAESGLEVNGVLAGPASDRDLVAIEESVNQSDGRLKYLGPVYGVEKTKFYARIDLFIFPTKYANEAQPTVIYEAMATGVPILSYDRGCIGGQLKDSNMLLKQDEHFVSWAHDKIKEIAASQSELLRLGQRAQNNVLADAHVGAKVIRKIVFGSETEEV